MQTLQANSLLQGGRYKILSSLGQGGFGITYLALQIGLERKVAISLRRTELHTTSWNTLMVALLMD